MANTVTGALWPWKCTHLTNCRFPSLKQRENNETCLLGLLGELHETIHVNPKHAAWHTLNAQQWLSFQAQRNFLRGGKSALSKMNLWALSLGEKPRRFLSQALESAVWRGGCDFTASVPRQLLRLTLCPVRAGLWLVLCVWIRRRVGMVFGSDGHLYRTSEKRNPSCLLVQATSMKTNPCVFTFCLDTGACSGYLSSNPVFLPASCVTWACIHSLE